MKNIVNHSGTAAALAIAMWALLSKQDGETVRTKKLELLNSAGEVDFVVTANDGRLLVNRPSSPGSLTLDLAKELSRLTLHSGSKESSVDLLSRSHTNSMFLGTDVIIQGNSQVGSQLILGAGSKNRRRIALQSHDFMSFSFIRSDIKSPPWPKKTGGFEMSLDQQGVGRLNNKKLVWGPLEK